MSYLLQNIQLLIEICFNLFLFTWNPRGSRAPQLRVLRGLKHRTGQHSLCRGAYITDSVHRLS